MSDHQAEFWDRIDDVTAGMLGLDGSDRLVPMSHYADKPLGILWFITAAGTDLVDALEVGAKPGAYIIASAHEGLYAHIKGTLTLSTDHEKLDDLWNTVASSWFDGDARDDDVRLLEFRLNQAEVWTSKGAASFFYQIAKANVTGEKPDIGEQFALTF